MYKNGLIMIAVIVALVVVNIIVAYYNREQKKVY